MRRATLDHVIILGGAARRLGDRPALAFMLRELIRFGVRRATLLGPAPDEATQDEIFRAVDLLPIRLDLALADAPPALDAPVLLMAGDMVVEANIARLLADFAADAPGVSARVLLQSSGAFGGVAAILPAASALLASHDPVAPLMRAGAAPGTTVPGRFLDLSDAVQARGAVADCAALTQRPALFLDRDGVLNHDHDYVGTIARWEWVAGALDAVRFATDHGWHVFVVTNQSGVARGYYTEAEARALLDWAADECRRHGGTIDDVRFCPYLPDAPLSAYRRDSDWRKPKPGMLNHVVAAWGLNPAHCLMVGDRATDAQAGEAAGMAARIFPGGNLLDFVRPLIAGGGLPNRVTART